MRRRSVRSLQLMSALLVLTTAPLSPARIARASSGAGDGQLWGSTYDIPGAEDWIQGFAMSPDGSKVFLTGQSFPTQGGNGTVATVAFDGATGTELGDDVYRGGEGSVACGL